MRNSMQSARGVLAVLGLAALAVPGTAEQGMWTFHNVPGKAIKQAYNFAPDQKWLDHVRLSSVRLMDGGSGSFVSSNGLLLTNHHVALGQLQKASSKGKDYVKDGFFARKAGEEIPCNDLEINVLESMEDVTARVQAAVLPGASDDEANKQRKAEMAKIEKESTDATGLRSDVVVLYNGGEYQLYRYKKFTDVRLVMAPEIGAAFYGGDPDNFTYPRHAMDFAFFRVYENGKPYQAPHHLKWSETGLKENELAFTSGHPGRTERLHTVAQLETIRDISNPAKFDGLTRARETLLAYAEEGPEQARQIKDEFFGVTNSLKVYQGRVEALKKPDIMDTKRREEAALRAAVEKDPALRDRFSKAWDQIAEVQKPLVERYDEYAHRNLGGVLHGGTLAGLAKSIVYYAEQTAKPNGERWAEYRDSALESLRQELFSPAPIHPEMEKRLLKMSLREALVKLGPKDPFVKQALNGRNAKQAAEEAIEGTKLLDVEYRKQLIAGGIDAVRASDDPLIKLALRLTPFMTETREWYEKSIQSIEIAASTLISQARFAVYGRDTYPDATFTLRLSYGKMAGYEEGTTKVPYKTTFWGLYGRAASFDNQEPFALPEKVAAAKDKVNMDTPLNFVTTNDIIGGNSGSPVVNKEGELVGLIFDGNIQSLEGDFVYDEKMNRALAVHSAGILEAMTKIYDMGDLAAELTKGVVQDEMGALLEQAEALADTDLVGRQAGVFDQLIPMAGDDFKALMRVARPLSRTSLVGRQAQVFDRLIAAAGEDMAALYRVSIPLSRTDLTGKQAVVFDRLIEAAGDDFGARLRVAVPLSRTDLVGRQGQVYQGLIEDAGQDVTALRQVAASLSRTSLVGKQGVVFDRLIRAAWDDAALLEAVARPLARTSLSGRRAQVSERLRELRGEDKPQA